MTLENKPSPASFSSISFHERVAKAYDDFSIQEKRIADYVMHHYEALNSYNSAELAKLIDVSKSTISRFFKKLGYEKYKSLRQELQILRQAGVPIANEISSKTFSNDFMAKHYHQEMTNLNVLSSQIDAQEFSKIISQMDKAKRIFIIGLRNSTMVALHLRQQLMQIRSDVHILPQLGQTFSEELVSLNAQDFVVMVGFRRRPAIFTKLLKQIQQQKCQTLLISEPKAKNLKHYANYSLFVPLDSVSAFDSYSMAFSLINLISNGLLHQNLAKGREHIYKVADMYKALDELEIYQNN